MPGIKLQCQRIILSFHVPALSLLPGLQIVLTLQHLYTFISWSHFFIQFLDFGLTINWRPLPTRSLCGDKVLSETHVEGHYFSSLPLAMTYTEGRKVSWWNPPIPLLPCRLYNSWQWVVSIAELMKRLMNIWACDLHSKWKGNMNRCYCLLLEEFAIWVLKRYAF